MKCFVTYFFISVLIAGSLCSCKKEYSYEGGPLSYGYLIKEGGNNCSSITVAGNYVVGKELTDTNFLQVQLYVNRPGVYNITSDHTNGYAFSF